MITDTQHRAARALLFVSQEDVARWSGVSKGTIANFERGARKPIAANLRALRAAFEEQGVEFIDEGDGKGPGARLVAPTA